MPRWVVNFSLLNQEDVLPEVRNEVPTCAKAGHIGNSNGHHLIPIDLPHVLIHVIPGRLVWGRGALHCEERVGMAGVPSLALVPAWGGVALLPSGVSGRRKGIDAPRVAVHVGTDQMAHHRVLPLTRGGALARERLGGGPRQGVALRALA